MSPYTHMLFIQSWQKSTLILTVHEAVIFAGYSTWSHAILSNLKVFSSPYHITLQSPPAKLQLVYSPPTGPCSEANGEDEKVHTYVGLSNVVMVSCSPTARRATQRGSSVRGLFTFLPALKFLYKASKIKADLRFVGTVPLKRSPNLVTYSCSLRIGRKLWSSLLEKS